MKYTLIVYATDVVDVDGFLYTWSNVTKFDFDRC